MGIPSGRVMGDVLDYRHSTLLLNCTILISTPKFRVEVLRGEHFVRPRYGQCGNRQHRGRDLLQRLRNKIPRSGQPSKLVKIAQISPIRSVGHLQYVSLSTIRSIGNRGIRYSCQLAQSRCRTHVARRSRHQSPRIGAQTPKGLGIGLSG